MLWANEASGGKVELPKHVLLINRYLLKVASGEIKRLIFCLPPRHAKSTSVSQWFTAWYLGQNPDHRVILTAYEANFAKSWGRKSRDILIEYGPKYFGINVNEDVAAAGDWGIAGHDGGMVTAGIGGPVMGRGANVFIIEDPLKNAQDAQSPTVQMAHMDWFQSTADTRLEPDGAIIIIMHRWDRLDLVGQLLELQENGDDGEYNDEKWVVINLPAIATGPDLLGRREGEALWPERWPLDRLLRKKARTPIYWWQSLYQQNPLAARGAGEKFNRKWFEIVDRIPPPQANKESRMVRWWDLAATEKRRGARDPDWTSGALLTKRGDNYYIVDITRAQATPAGVERLIAETAEKDGPDVEQYMEQEPGASGKALIDHYKKVLAKHRFRGRKLTGKKESFIDNLSSASEPLHEQQWGSVKLFGGNGGKWISFFLEQAELWPTGEHDDDLDACSKAKYILDNVHQMRVYTFDEKPHDLLVPPPMIQETAQQRLEKSIAEDCVEQVMEGKPLQNITLEQYRDGVRSALQDYAGKCIDNGDMVRAHIAICEVRRLDRVLGFSFT